jgi:glycine/D-amino acid oxidase-like deaminating enzyme
MTRRRRPRANERLARSLGRHPERPGGRSELARILVEIIETHPEHPQIAIASACSGHGFKFGIEIGRILAALALGQAPGSDLGRFRLGRPSLTGAWRNDNV